MHNEILGMRINSTLVDIANVSSCLFCLYMLSKAFLVPFYTYVIAPKFNKVNFKAYGKWALVTGCTDGIGKEYARQLAAVGCDIILVSRSMEKLQATAQEIEKDFNVSTKIIQVDFTGGDEIYDTIEKEIAGLEIGTLVNNVGISYTYPEYFLDLVEMDKVFQKLLKANIVSVTRMTHMVLPGMVSRERGIVINIGSASSIIPSPMLTVYAATKAYVDKFTEGLDMEYYMKNILFQCVMPGFVCSNMSGIRRSSLFAPTAKTFVKSALSLVAVEKRTAGYYPHEFFVDCLNILVTASYNFGVWIVTRSMKNSRLKCLKKMKKQ